MEDMRMDNRFEAFRKQLRSGGFDFALIHKRENMRYLSGFTGEGCLLVGGARPALLTSFLYLEQAQRQAEGYQVIRVGGEVKLNEALALLLGEGEPVLAVETDFVTADQYRELERALPKAKLQPLGGLPEQLRSVKDANEIGCIERACAIVCRAFDALLHIIKPGMTEKALQVELDYTLLKLGSEASAFETIVCSGPNGSLPHATPGERTIQAGDLVTFDFGATCAGYRSDVTRTVAIGRISDELTAIYETVLGAQCMALDAIRPGAVCSSVDQVARAFIEAK